MSTNTLTSLAILKVNLDHGRDYLDYLRPFILQILVTHRPDPVTDGVVSELILNEFGLEIPDPVVSIVLRRIGRASFIKRLHGVYRVIGDIPDPQVHTKMVAAERQIMAVASGLRRFSQETANPIPDDDGAVTAICTFLSEFDITCLRSYLRGTAIPNLQGSRQSNIVLVSDYIQHIQQNAPMQFNSFCVLLQGNMLANALMCPDLRSVSTGYDGVSFYCDTPLLVRRLGVEGTAKENAARDLISLVKSLGGRVAAFSHSRDELQNVLQGAAHFLDRPDGRGTIVQESRRNGVTKSDLLLLAASIDDKLPRSLIDIDPTPKYIEEFQIDETVFERVLDDEVSYYNPRAKQYDINSVRSIYVIRADRPARSVETSRAIFVTSNRGFASAAWEYGQRHESTKDVSSVITDFSLTNMAWLMAPMAQPSVPTTQLLAYSYAALEPSRELLDRYLREIDRLEARGTISSRDHQILRSSPQVYPELMHLTLGEEAALTTETVSETLERVSNDIKREELAKLTEERDEHQETRDELERQKVKSRNIVKSIHDRCTRNGRRAAIILSVGLTILIAIGLTSGLSFTTAISRGGTVIVGSVGALVLMTMANIVFGASVKGFYNWLSRWVTEFLLRRKLRAIGLDIEEYSL